jgi:DNA-binding response OmpR family regulator
MRPNHFAARPADGHLPERRPVNHLGRVLVVDGDDEARLLLRAALDLEGFAVSTCEDGPAAIRSLRSASTDLVILDLLTPGIAGLDLLRAVTEVHRGALIVLTGIEAVDARVRALDLGADDFIVKGVTQREVIARVHAVLRRAMVTSPTRTIEFGSVAVDLDAREVRVDGDQVAFTTKEFDLLVFLARHPGRVFTRHQLLAGVWMSTSDWQDEATVTEHVRRVRYKIERVPCRPERLVTVRGVGYRFERRASVESPALTTAA